MLFNVHSCSCGRKPWLLLGVGCGVLGTATLTSRYLAQAWMGTSVAASYLDVGMVVGGLLLCKNASYLGYSTAVALYIAEATPQACKSVVHLRQRARDGIPVS